MTEDERVEARAKAAERLRGAVERFIADATPEAWDEVKGGARQGRFYAGPVGTFYAEENMATLTGIEAIKYAATVFADCNGDFVGRFTATQLLLLADALHRCAWDIYPDKWAERQIREAIQGIPPRWDDQERPLYGPGR